MPWIKDEKKRDKKCPVCGEMMKWLDMPLDPGYHCETCAQSKLSKVPSSMGGIYYAVVSEFIARNNPIPGDFSATSVVYNLFKKPEEAKKHKSRKQVIVEVLVEAENMTSMPQGLVSRIGSNKFVIVKVVF